MCTLYFSDRRSLWRRTQKLPWEKPEADGRDWRLGHREEVSGNWSHRQGQRFMEPRSGQASTRWHVWLVCFPSHAGARLHIDFVLASLSILCSLSCSQALVILTLLVPEDFAAEGGTATNNSKCITFVSDKYTGKVATGEGRLL